MSENLAEQDERRQHPDVPHEKKDASRRAILLILAGIFASAVVIHLGVLWYLRVIEDHAAADKRSPFPVAPAPSTALPANPRLEQVDRLAGDTTPNIRDLFVSGEALLNSYGPTADAAYVHIPIDRAIDLFVQQQASIPRPAGPGYRACGLLDAGEPNSGRVYQRKRP